jgi:hypothetical protein
VHRRHAALIGDELADDQVHRIGRHKVETLVDAGQVGQIRTPTERTDHPPGRGRGPRLVATHQFIEVQDDRVGPFPGQPGLELRRTSRQSMQDQPRGVPGLGVINEEGGLPGPATALIGLRIEHQRGPPAPATAQLVEGHAHGVVMVVSRVMQLGNPLRLPDHGATKRLPLKVEADGHLMHDGREQHAADRPRLEDVRQAPVLHPAFIRPEFLQGISQLLRPQPSSVKHRAQERVRTGLRLRRVHPDERDPLAQRRSPAPGGCAPSNPPPGDSGGSPGFAPPPPPAAASPRKSSFCPAAHRIPPPPKGRIFPRPA